MCTSSRQKNSTTASTVPSWMTAVKAVNPAWLTFGLSQAWTNRRWPVEDTGRNSVSPCTKPYSAAWTALTCALMPRSCQRCGQAERERHEAAPESDRAWAAVRR